jgi:hypothetical protein
MKMFVYFLPHFRYFYCKFGAWDLDQQKIEQYCSDMKSVDLMRKGDRLIAIECPFYMALSQKSSLKPKNK